MLPEISASVRKPVLAPADNYEQHFSQMGCPVITILRFVSSIENDTFGSEMCDIFNIEGHRMIMATTDVFLQMVISPGNITLCIGLLHHFEEKSRLVRLHRGAKEDPSEELAIFECERNRKPLLISAVVATCIDPLVAHHHMPEQIKKTIICMLLRRS